MRTIAPASTSKIRAKRKTAAQPQPKLNLTKPRSTYSVGHQPRPKFPRHTSNTSPHKPRPTQPPLRTKTIQRSTSGHKTSSIERHPRKVKSATQSTKRTIRPHRTQNKQTDTILSHSRRRRFLDPHQRSLLHYGFTHHRPGRAQQTQEAKKLDYSGSLVSTAP